MAVGVVYPALRPTTTALESYARTVRSTKQEFRAQSRVVGVLLDTLQLYHIKVSINLRITVPYKHACSTHQGWGFVRFSAFDDDVSEYIGKGIRYKHIRAFKFYSRSVCTF